MKTHLPPILRRALIAAFCVTAVTLGTSSSNAAHLHSDVSLKTYTDFGQNMGRYKVREVNELLQYLNRDGVKITYTGGQETFTLPHEMISFESTDDRAYATKVGPNAFVTVLHNVVLNPTYTSRYIGASNAIHYQGIEYQNSEGNRFRLTPGISDYKMTRTSKIITDVTSSQLYDSVGNLEQGHSIVGEYEYRAGSGKMSVVNKDGSPIPKTGAYYYITGGLTVITTASKQVPDGTTDNRGLPNDSFRAGVTNVKWGTNGVSEKFPLPFVGQGGDSGSPMWVWDEASQSYQLFSVIYGGGGNNTYSYGASQWTEGIMEYYNKTVDMPGGDSSTVYLHAVDAQGTEVISDSINNVSTQPWYGKVTDGTGNVLTEFCGVQSGLHTWRSLTDIKNTDNWYSYDADYLNAAAAAGTRDLTHADLFMTENLVFQSASGNNRIVLDGDVDLGIGYVQFSRGTDQASASFTVSGSVPEAMLNSAGYVIDEGVAVHLQLTNTDAAYMREWRKTGAGDLYLEGSGNNEIFLNVGGSGTTCLQQSGGYAAYNVLINNGAVVVLGGGDINQVQRDVTFGYGGGTLDFNGAASMTWNNGNTADADGFTVHALTEDGIITNTRTGTTTVLTYTQSGAETFAGSFRDTADSGLNVIYDGGAGSAWTLNGIHTSLLNANSGLTVASGSVTLAGTNTVHGMGSLNGESASRWTSSDDWHYADASMNVTVKNGSVFTLGSHARLTGDVTVEAGGSFVMNEGVKSRYEYIEGGPLMEDTYAVSEFYGLKGNVSLGDGANMKVQYREGTTSGMTYGGSITGTGNLSVDLGTAGGSLTLTGTNTFTGTKEILAGGLIAHVESLGNMSENKWKVGEQSYLAIWGNAEGDLLQYIDSSSTGALALTEDRAGALDIRSHAGLIIGALEGCTVQYGQAGTTEILRAVNNQWVLGGGGGELVVNFLLSGRENTLVLGNQYTKGMVMLANTGNNFGGISFAGGVTLHYTDPAALGGSMISLQYTNRVLGSEGVSNIVPDSSGVLLLDNMAAQDVDLSNHKKLYLGSEGDMTYAGTVTLAEGEAYRFGGMTCTLTLGTVLQGAHDLIVDGQTYSGGTLLLSQVEELTGNVSVMGYDSEQTSSAMGDATLSFSVDDALARAGAITVKDGGIIDLNGTTQTFRNLSTEDGGFLGDSSTEQTGTLKIVSDTSTTLRGIISVSAVEKTGDGVLGLEGTNYYETFTILEGAVALNSATALSETGLMCVEKDTLLQTGNNNTKGQIVLNGGTLQTAANTLAGGVYVLSGQTGYLVNASGGTTSITGKLEVAEDASLMIQEGTYQLEGKSFNESGGTLNLSASKLILFNEGGPLFHEGDESALAIGGTLSVSGPAVTLQSSGSNNNMLREIAHLNIAANANLTIAEESWNTVWKIHRLTGEGNMVWNSGTSHRFSARLVLDGEGEFNGNITFQRTRNDANRAYGAYLELAHDKAAQNATVTLTGSSATGMATLAVNTENAQIVSLTGNQFSHLYAGESIVGEKEGTPLKNAPQSTRAATLTLTGGGTSAFSGVVAGGAEGTANGLSLVMNGTGTQIFNGSTVAVQHVTVNRGTLNLNSNNLTVGGDITIAQGGTLGLGQSFSLADGHTLSVIDGDGQAQTAVLNSALELAGGTVSFSGKAMGADTAALTLGGVSLGSGLASQTVNFSDTSFLLTGVRYWLANGDWTSLSSAAFTASGLDYLTAGFDLTGNGLYVTFGAVAGHSIWGGTASQNTWGSEIFGGASSVPGTGDTAVFNDGALSKEVKLTGDVSVGSLRFDSSLAYSISSEGAYTLTAGSLSHTGSGITELGSTVRVTGDTVINAGELVVKNAATLAGGISGAGTLGVDFGTGSGSFANLGSIGTLHVISGEYAAGAAVVQAGTIRVDDGGSFSATSGTHTADFVLGGRGVNTGSSYSGALKLGAVTLAGGVSLQSDAALNVSGTANITGTLSTGDYTLTKYGAGTLSLANTNAGGHLSIAEGKLQLGSGEFKQIQSLDLGRGTTLILPYGAGLSGCGISMADASSIELRNGAGTSTLLNANIIIDGTASIKGSIYGNATSVSGTIGGNGTLNLAYTGKNTWRINSAISDGEGGSLALNAASNVTLGGANSYTGGTMVSNGTLIAASYKALGNGGVTMTGGTVKLNSDLEISSLEGSKGTVNLNGKTLVMNGNQEASASYSGTLTGGSVYKTGAGTQALIGAQVQNVQVSSGALGLDNGTVSGNVWVKEQGRLQMNGMTATTVKQDKSATISGATMHGEGRQTTIAAASAESRAQVNDAAIHLDAGSSLALDHVLVTSTSRLTGSAASLVANDLVLQAANGVNAYGAAGESLLAGTSLYQSGSMELPALTLGAEKSVYHITCTGVDNLQIIGTSLTIDLNGFNLDLLGDYDLFSFTFGEGDSSATFNLADLAVTAVNGDQTYTGYSETQDGTTTLYFGNPEATPTAYSIAKTDMLLSVPEPATATLSLLSLAVLAFRRRRS